MEPSFTVDSRPGEVSISPSSLNWALGVTFPFYALHSNGLHPDTYSVVVDASIDGKPAKCNIVAIVGDYEEPITVIFQRIYEEHNDTFVVLDWKDGVDNGEEYQHGELEPRQMIYIVSDFKAHEAPHVREIVRQLM